MKKQARKHIILWIYGTGVVVGSVITMLMTFYYAYLNDYVFAAKVNVFGEFIPEVIILSTGLIAFMYETVRMFTREKEGK